MQRAHVIKSISSNAFVLTHISDNHTTIGPDDQDSNPQNFLILVTLLNIL